MTAPKPKISGTSDGAETANMKTLNVGLNDRSYPIYIGQNLLARAPALLSDCFARKKTVIITDANVAAAHLNTLSAAFKTAGFTCDEITLEPGEPTKSFSALEQLCDQLLVAGIERDDTLIAFGGGVIGDLAGFAAAILRRGVKFVQIPTTLLAQVDSSVGGKTGINSKHGKNLIGAFYQPLAVLADISLLDTLPKRQFLSGYAEVVKYGVLGDADFFSWLEHNQQKIMDGDKSARIKMVETCCKAKADIVALDEREAGVRALLNLGHTFGHSLEAATNFSDRLTHGEGVAIGMVMACKLSEQLKLCPQATADRVVSHLQEVGLPAGLNDVPGDLPNAENLLDIMRQDKKAVAGEMALILINKIGDAFSTRDVEEDVLKTFLGKQLELK